MGWSPQAPLSMGFPRQVYWNRLPLPSLGDLPEPEIEPVSCISCVGRWLLYHCATWEAPPSSCERWYFVDIPMNHECSSWHLEWWIFPGGFQLTFPRNNRGVITYGSYSFIQWISYIIWLEFEIPSWPMHAEWMLCLQHENNMNLVVHLHQSFAWPCVWSMSTDILKGIFLWSEGLNNRPKILQETMW